VIPLRAALFLGAAFSSAVIKSNAVAAGLDVSICEIFSMIRPIIPMQRSEFLQFLSFAPLAGLFDRFPTRFTQYSDTIMESLRMPVLFIGHGNPMNAISDNAFSQSWEAIAAAIQVTQPFGIPPDNISSRSAMPISTRSIITPFFIT